MSQQIKMDWTSQNVGDAIEWMKETYTAPNQVDVLGRMQTYGVTPRLLHNMRLEILRNLLKNEFAVDDVYKMIHMDDPNQQDGQDPESVILFQLAQMKMELQSRRDWSGVALSIIFPCGARNFTDIRQDWLRDDRYVEECCNRVIPIPLSGIDYISEEGLSIRKTGNSLWGSGAFVMDLYRRLKKQNPVVVLQAKYSHAEFQTGLMYSITQRCARDEVVGSACHRLERYESLGRLKKKSIIQLMRLLRIPIHDWGSDGDNLQRRFSDDERTMQARLEEYLCGETWKNIRTRGRPVWNPEEVVNAYELYEVSHIVDSEEDGAEGNFYKVRWIGYPSADDDTWEPEENVPSNLIEDYYEMDVDEDQMDAFRSKVDLCLVWRELQLSATGLKFELMSKKNARVAAHKNRAMEYAAQSLEENSAQGFGISLLIRGTKQYWVFVCFRSAGRFCWFCTDRLPVDGSPTTPRLADIILSLGKAGPRALGIFPGAVEVRNNNGIQETLHLTQAIAFGGESCVFQACVEDPMMFTVNRRMLPAYHVSAKVYAVKFWRDVDAFRRFFKKQGELVQKCGKDCMGRLLMGFCAWPVNPAHACGVMPVALSSEMIMNATYWQDLARRLLNFHRQTNHVHLDISPKNIVFHEDRLMLIDYGSMVRVGEWIGENQMTTLSLFPEAADYPDATFYQDRVMFLRTVSIVAKQGKSVYSVSVPEEKEALSVEEHHPATVLDPLAPLGDESFVSRVGEIFGFKSA